jgi:hypothetical protein
VDSGGQRTPVDVTPEFSSTGSKIDNRYAQYHTICTHRSEAGGINTVRTMPPNDEFGVPGGESAGIIYLIVVHSFLI